jgi:hypothetical protein
MVSKTQCGNDIYQKRKELTMPPTVYPTGTTIYKPEKCWNGCTVFQPREIGATLIDMNGNVVNRWRDLQGFPSSNKILPGGYVIGSTGVRDPKYGFQDNVDIIQVDWDGNIIWKFNKYELVKDSHRRPTWMARQHHDFQREGNPVGYYAPDMNPLVDRGNTLMACHKNLKKPNISDKLLLDDTIIEVTWDGEVVWEWICSEHFESLGLSEEAKNVLARNPGMMDVGGGMGDWMHLNSVSKLGPNKFFDLGDERFYPDNIIWSGRETNIMGIIDKKTGKVIWQIGPDYMANTALRKLGQVIGPHHVHMIPRGLPGDGNILVFDNGGWAGYGAPNPGSPTGRRNALRDYSRVIEFNPITLEIIWQYPAPESGYAISVVGNKLYSALMSSIQRLPNGNTLITEGANGRIFEITVEYEIVWEYINPYFSKKENRNLIYRAYRVPYEWIPQLEPPKVKAIPRIENKRFRVPKAPHERVLKTTKLKK